MSRTRKAGPVAVAAGLVAMLLALLAGCTKEPVDPGRDAAHARLRDYVAALNTNRAQDVGLVVRRPADSDDVAERLRAYGGRALAAVEVSSINEFPRVYHTSVRATDGAGAAVAFDQVIEWQDDHWSFAPFAP